MTSGASSPTFALSGRRSRRHGEASRGTSDIRSPEQLTDDDWRKTNPRFTCENFQYNLRIVDDVRAVAVEARATPAQIALAWLLARGDDIAPIPGTKRVARVEEETAAGERHDEGNMAVIDR